VYVELGVWIGSAMAVMKPDRNVKIRGSSSAMQVGWFKLINREQGLWIDEQQGFSSAVQVDI